MRLRAGHPARLHTRDRTAVAAAPPVAQRQPDDDRADQQGRYGDECGDLYALARLCVVGGDAPVRRG
jgi:hypothetical protein